MAINFISGGTSQNVTGETLFSVGSNVKQGVLINPSGYSVDGTIFTVDRAQGSLNPVANPGLRTERVPNAPSGYDVDGNATYGDGKRNVVNSINKDLSFFNPTVEFNRPLGPSGVYYSSLT